MNAHPARITEIAEQLSRAIQPERVLEVSAQLSPVAQALRARGVEVFTRESLDEAVERRYDLVIFHEILDSLPLPQAIAAIQHAAPAANTILYSPGREHTPQPAMVWLRLFHDAGFSPDLLYEADPLAPACVLLRRAAAKPQEFLTVFSELMRLNDSVRACRQELAALRTGGTALPQAGSVPDPAYAQLEKSLAELRLQIADALELQNGMADRFDGRITQLQSRLNRTTHDVQDILHSRIWRSLVAAGGVALRMARLGRPVPNRPQSLGSANGTSGEPFLRVVCDEPKPSEKALSGTVIFRGWAGATSGITKIEIQPAGHEPVAARGGLYRPDIARDFPDLIDGDRVGFQASIDTSALPNGVQTFVIRAFTKSGAKTELNVPRTIDHVSGYASDYYRWIAEFEKRDARLIEMRLQSFPRNPLISILVPVYRTKPAVLEKMIESVRRQSYGNWELCLADDCSQSRDIDAIFQKYAATDPRIRTVQLPANGGISKASNAAYAIARGEYIGLLDHDDELAGDALYHIVNAINHQPEAEIFYSDEDHIDEDGVRSDPFFKPDWSPDLILGINYVCHFLVFRADLGRAAGGFRSECDLSQDHDILLRMSLRAKQIVHIPHVLYHWRTEVFTMKRASHQTSRALITSRRVVDNYLKLAGISASVEPGAVSGRWRVRYELPEPAPAVDIIIPCGGKVDLLERCMNSVASDTDYPDYNITVVDNSRSGRVEQFVRGWSRRGRKANYVDWRNRPFNFSAMNNDAAKTCQAPLLLFLNDDVTVINADWLRAMVELGARPEVGAVGAKLLYPDGRIQHAGLTVGLLGTAGHAFKGMFSDERIYFDFPDVIRNVSAVTGACMLASAQLYREVGGFDEQNFPVAYNDVDLCLKILEKGKRILYTPHAQLYHYEAFSKRSEDKDPRPAETKAFQKKWKQYIESDPFYSPNLTRTDEDFSLRKKT